MEVVSPALPKILLSNKFLLNSHAIPTSTIWERQVQLSPRIIKPSSKPMRPAPSPTIAKPNSNNPSGGSSSSHTTSDILRLMDSLSLPIPSDIYTSLIKECTIARHSRRALELHSHIKNSRIKLSLPLQNRLLLMHVSCEHLDIAHQLFDQMFLRDFNSWAIMIVACLHAGDFEKAIAYFVSMEYRNFIMFKFPAWVIVCILKSCVLAKNMELGKQLHGQLLKLGGSNNLSLSVSLINFYGNFRCLDDANFVFDQLSQRNTATWTAKIVNSCREDQFDKVIGDFIAMGRQSIKKNGFTFSSVIKACAGMNDDAMCGRQVHANAIKLGLESDVFVQSGLINMYGKCRLRDAEKAFEIVNDKRNTACWNAMLMGYLRNDFCVEALKLLYRMEEAGIKVQESLVNNVKIACASTSRNIYGTYS